MATFFAPGLQYKTRPVPVAADAGCLLVQDNEYAIPAAGLSANDIVVLGILPAGHALVDAYLAATDLDAHGTPEIMLSLGLGNKTVAEVVAAPASPPSDIASNKVIVTSSNVGQAGGIARMSNAQFMDLDVNWATDRYIVMKVDTAAATAAAGTVKGVIMYRPAAYKA